MKKEQGQPMQQQKQRQRHQLAYPSGYVFFLSKQAVD